jgi:hypothetical protein
MFGVATSETFDGPNDPDSVNIPRTLGIHKHPLVSSTATSTPVKHPKTSSTGTRPRASDFDELTQAVLDTTIAEYRAVICTEDPFLDMISNQEISAQVWVNACATLDIQIQPSLQIMKLVCLYSSITSKLTFIYR